MRRGAATLALWRAPGHLAWGLGAAEWAVRPIVVRTDRADDEYMHNSAFARLLSVALISAGVLSIAGPSVAQTSTTSATTTTPSTTAPAATSSTTTTTALGAARTLPEWWAERCARARNHGAFVSSVPKELRVAAAQSNCGKPKSAARTNDRSPSTTSVTTTPGSTSSTSSSTTPSTTTPASSSTTPTSSTVVAAASTAQGLPTDRGPGKGGNGNANGAKSTGSAAARGNGPKR